MTPAAFTALSPRTDEETGDGAFPELRLVRAPSWEPEYDDECGLPHVGLLPMPPPLRLLPAAAPASDDDEDEPAFVRTPRSDLPEPRPFAHSLVQRLLEVVSGVRPVSQLHVDLTPALYGQLEDVLTAQIRPTGVRPTSRSVRSLHIQERPEGIAEVCATIVRSGRAAAVAFRLEGRNGVWCCTELVGALTPRPVDQPS